MAEGLIETEFGGANVQRQGNFLLETRPHG
jgi:hypothetical protein